MPCRWQAASKLANRLGLFSRGSVKTQAQRERRNSVITNSIRKVSSHLHRHRHSESLMVSYLRMQAAAADAHPACPGREGQAEKQNERQHKGQGEHLKGIPLGVSRCRLIGTNWTASQTFCAGCRTCNLALVSRQQHTAVPNMPCSLIPCCLRVCKTRKLQMVLEMMLFCSAILRGFWLGP